MSPLIGQQFAVPGSTFWDLPEALLELLLALAVHDGDEVGVVANPVQAFAPGDEGGTVVVVAAAPVHVGVDGADGAVVGSVIVKSAPHGRDQILPDGRCQLKDFCQFKDGCFETGGGGGRAFPIFRATNKSAFSANAQ